MDSSARIGVVGATGAVGTVTLELLRERGYGNVRAFASSAGKQAGNLTVEEATPEALSSGDLDLCLFSVTTSASRELVPDAVRGGAIAVDKSSAYRLQDGVPLVVPEVNGERALDHDGIVANPNCCAIPLTMALKPLHDAAGLARVRVSTYQSVSGAGLQRMEELRAQASAEGDLGMDWEFDGEEFDEESKLRAETRKILELPGCRSARRACACRCSSATRKPCGWRPRSRSTRTRRGACSVKRRGSGSRTFRHQGCRRP